MDQQVNLVEQRLSSLERQNRRLRILLAVLFAAALAPLFVSVGAQTNASSNIVRAEQFEVVKNGKTMLRLSSTEQGGDLRLFNMDGNTIVFVTVYEHGGGMKLSNLAGQNPVVTLGSSTSDAGFLYLGPGDGKNTAELEGGSTPSMTLKNSQGAQTFRVP